MALKAKCSNCGKEYDLDLMDKLITGRSVKYMCPKCSHKGNSDVTFRNKRYLRGDL